MSGFLKCDADGCDHQEDCPEYGAHMIGKPCPKCGANLLTQEDFDAYEPIRKVLEVFKSMGLASKTVGEDMVAMSVHQHAGKMTIEIDRNSEKGES